MTDEDADEPADPPPARPRVEIRRRHLLEPLHRVGRDPDPRFTLANERTFLAWNRTALALMAGGLAVSRLLPDFDLPGGNAWLGVPLTLLGGSLAFISYYRWYAVERAMREDQPIPIARVPAMLGLAIAAVAVFSAILIAIG